MQPTRCLFDLSHNNPLPASTYAGDLPLFQQAMRGGWIALMHKLSQGASFQDPVAIGRLKMAAQAGLLIGGYHFMTADPISSQVANFMQVAGQIEAAIGSASFVLALDNEPGSSNPATGMSTPTAQTDAAAAEFVTAVYHATGAWPLVYGGRYNFFSSATCGNLLACPLWLAEYGTDPVCPTGWINWIFHQYSDGQQSPNPVTIPGVGAVDQSEYAGSVEELVTWWTG
jgi:lysozyme